MWYAFILFFSWIHFISSHLLFRLTPVILVLLSVWMAKRSHYLKITNLLLPVRSPCHYYYCFVLTRIPYSDEFDRIKKSGGFVEFGRVNGNLALSRAFGDLEYKNNKKLPPEEQAVTGTLQDAV